MRHFKDFADLQIPDFIDGSWEDRSWKNDACGALFRRLRQGQATEYPGLRLWVEYDDVGDREYDDERYQLECLDSEECWCNGKAVVLYHGSDEVELMRIVRMVTCT